MPLEQMLPIDSFIISKPCLPVTLIVYHPIYFMIVSLFKEQVFAHRLVNLYLTKILIRKENCVQIDHNYDIAIFSVKVKIKGRHTHS